MADPRTIDRLLQDVAAGRLSRRAFVARAGALGLGLSAIGSLLAGCGRDKADPPPGEAPLGAIEPELTIANWSDYIAPDTITSFEREFGVRVTYETYESNEELLQRLAGAGAPVDVAFPTNYAVTTLAATGLLAPLRRAYLPNMTTLAPTFVNPVFDPDNVYSIAYQWGTTGFAYRSDKVPGTPDSWGIFLDGRYKGRMTQMDEMRACLGAWLRYRGASLNSSEPTDLAQARSDALAARRNLKGYVSAPVKGQLISGDVWVAQLWNGDTAQAQAKEPSIRYVLPKEGSDIWTDSMVLPAAGTHPRAAHEFLNYILRPEVGAAIANTTGYGSPNQAALASMTNPLPYPTAAEFQRLEYERTLGDAGPMWEQIWQELQSA